MEDLLPFLAGLAYMAYRVYSNYQKGQEEARSRKPSQPYQSRVPETYNEWKEQEDGPIINQEPAPTPYQEPKYQSTYKESTIGKSYKKSIPKRVELTNPESPSEEVVRNRKIHQPHQHQFVPSHEEFESQSEFDFRDAVIKEAVLNRPQY